MGEASERRELPSASFVIRRDLFARIGPFPIELCGDTLMSYRAAACGAQPWFEPRAVLLHNQLTNRRQFLTERYRRGKDYGSVRPRLQGWSRVRAIAYTAAPPLILAVSLARAIRHALMTGHCLMLLWHLPVVVAGSAARTLGEAMAHGRSCWRTS